MAAINRSEQYLTIHSQLESRMLPKTLHVCMFGVIMASSSLTAMYISGSVEFLSLESVAVDVDVN